MLAHGIEPIVTLCHFETPVAVVRRCHSRLSRETIDLYLRFVRTVVESLKGKARYWATFNDMNHIDPMSEATDIFIYMIAGLTGTDLADRPRDLAALGCYMTVAGMLAERMVAAAEAKGVEAKIWAVGEQAADANVPEADVVLVGPQMRFKVPELQATYAGKPIDAIDMRDYGMMNGEAVLDKALALVG